MIQDTWWELLPGGGYLVLEGRSGPGPGLYLYPDCLHAIRGEWNEAGELVCGQACLVERLQVEGGVCLVRPGPPSGPALSFQPSTATWLAQYPTLPDPYEAATVEVRTSGAAGAGEGLFARRVREQII